MGRPPAYEFPVATRAQMFAEKLKRVRRKGDAFIAACKEAWEPEFALYRDKADTTQKLYVNMYRRRIAEMLGDESPALDVVKIPTATTEAINAAYTSKIAFDNRNLIKIERWRDLVAIAAGKLNSNEPLSVIAALALLTGRRSYELVCSARFMSRVTQGERGGRVLHKFEVEFSGQAKTRGRAGTQFGETYPIQVLAPARAIIDAHDRFRTSMIGMEMGGATNPEFSAAYTAKLNEVVRRDYGHLWPDAPLSIKCFRPLYAEIAFKMIKPKGMSKNAYFATILGHSADDLTTALSYFDYYLEDGDQFDAIKLREHIQEMLRADSYERDKPIAPPYLEGDEATKEAEGTEAATADAPAGVPPRRGRGRPKMATTEKRQALLAYVREHEPVADVPREIASLSTVERALREGLLTRLKGKVRRPWEKYTSLALTEHGRNVLDTMTFRGEHHEPVAATPPIEATAVPHTAIPTPTGEPAREAGASLPSAAEAKTVAEETSKRPKRTKAPAVARVPKKPPGKVSQKRKPKAEAKELNRREIRKPRASNKRSSTAKRKPTTKKKGSK